MKAEETNSIQSLFAVIDKAETASEGKQRPLIGVSANIFDDNSAVRLAYTQAITAAGGVPVILPLQTDPEIILQTIDAIDGLVLSGGGDIDAAFLNEPPHPNIGIVSKERDIFDLTLIRLAVDKQLPMLCICRGHQMLNIAMGGDIWQDIVEQQQLRPEVHDQKEERHLPSHLVRIEKDSYLSRLLGRCEIEANSFHHQAARAVAPGFRSVATTDDGINEAIESLTPPQRIVSVQWHPETMAAAGELIMMKLFDNIVNEAALYRRARYLHEEMISLDSHCDTPMHFTEGYNIGEKKRAQILVQPGMPKRVDTVMPVGLVDLVKMREGYLDAICMAAYIPQRDRDDASLKKATQKALQTLKKIHEQVAMNSTKVGIATNRDEILSLKKEGKRTILPCIENGYAVGKDLKNLAAFKKLGVVYITLCHNGDNDICDSASGNAEHNGLSRFGREVVNEMNRLGILIDVSHASDKTFYDALEASKAPIIASHSSARALCKHRRNLSDEQMKALAAKGGVVQICLYNLFLSSKGDADINTIITHIDHAVSVAGIDHVGIGSDFDGGGGVPGCADASQMLNITIELLRKGYSLTDIEKIWGGNFLRVLKASQDLSNIQ